MTELRSRRRLRLAFLGLSAVVFFGVAIAAHEVMLPFLFAAIIAYVLTPLVSLVERRRLPRALAIVLVYVGVLGGMYLFVRLTAPRIGQEIGALRGELPKVAQSAKTQWIPSVQQRLEAWGIGQREGEDVEPQPAMVVRPQPDGSYAIDVGQGVTIEPRGNDRWVVLPRERPRKLDFTRIAGDAMAKTSEWAQQNAVEVAKIGGNLVMGAARGIFVCGITLMLAAYLMLTREKILAFFASLVSASARPQFDSLLKRIDRGLSGVVRGQLIICVINGVLSAVGFAIVGLKYWPVLALVAAVLSIIPIFGSILSSVPAVAIGLTQGFGTAVFVLVWIIGIHQLEANFLNPKIMGDAAKIHPVLVVFSLIVGEHLFHVVGALLAVPCLSIAQSVFLHFRQALAEAEPAASDETDGALVP